MNLNENEATKSNYEIPEKLLNVKELSDALRVPRSWVYSRTRVTGPASIPRLNVGKYIRFRFSEVLAWIEHQNKVGD